MRMRWLVPAILMLVTACTSTSTSTSGVPVPTVDGSPASTTPSEPPATTLADGSALPEGCDGKEVPSETVAFVAEGRAWALDPASDRLSCLFEVTDPGPFAFGPQGDRVLLADMQVQGLSAKSPTLAPKGSTPTVFDWGHPLGLAIVFANSLGDPLKRFVDDGHVERLADLPDGTYQAIAYHPSGLALGFIVDEGGGRQGIWISTKEGKDPQRLVFSKPDTVFSSLAFSPDGQKLWWIAQHAGAISEIHWMDLADRSGFSQVLSRGLDPTAHGLLLAPSGPLMAATQGEGCADSQAMFIDGDGAHAALPGEQPTQALGWLDAKTLLVSAGGCGQQEQLFAVGQHADHAVLLVNGVDIGAPRTVLQDAPTEVPAPAGDATPAPPGGVG